MNSVHLLEKSHHQETDDRTIFGFWVYLMTDCILFGCLFATYAVLCRNTYGGPSGRELFSLPSVLAETLFLLFSSYTCGLSMLATRRGYQRAMLSWLFVTWLLGASFLAIELHEFHALYESGNSWQRSGFLSSFFTLVGTHGLHITSGLLWILVLMKQTATRGITAAIIRRQTCFSLFWHFLDVVWIFIFSIVYMIGEV